MFLHGRTKRYATVPSWLYIFFHFTFYVDLQKECTSLKKKKKRRENNLVYASLHPSLCTSYHPNYWRYTLFIKFANPLRQESLFFFFV